MFAEKLRDREENQNIHVTGGLELNEDTVEVSVDGEPVRLTPIEYKILLLLMKSPRSEEHTSDRKSTRLGRVPTLRRGSH